MIAPDVGPPAGRHPTDRWSSARGDRTTAPGSRWVDAAYDRPWCVVRRAGDYSDLP